MNIQLCILIFIIIIIIIMKYNIQKFSVNTIPECYYSYKTDCCGGNCPQKNYKYSNTSPFNFKAKDWTNGGLMNYASVEACYQCAKQGVNCTECSMVGNHCSLLYGGSAANIGAGMPLKNGLNRHDVMSDCISAKLLQNKADFYKDLCIDNKSFAEASCSNDMFWGTGTSKCGVQGSNGWGMNHQIYEEQKNILCK